MIGTAQLQAYERIRDKILAGIYPGGMKLVETKLAEEFGMSRTPIREAIRRLEQEGLIKRKRVYKPTATDLKDLFQMRILIECYAAKMAATVMTESQVQRLRECITAVKIGTIEEILQANKNFHDLIVQECRNPMMIDTLNRMKSIIHLFNCAAILHKRPCFLEEHEQIFQAIESRNPQLASDLMEAHLQADLAFFLRLKTTAHVGSGEVNTAF